VNSTSTFNLINNQPFPDSNLHLWHFVLLKIENIIGESFAFPLKCYIITSLAELICGYSAREAFGHITKACIKWRVLKFLMLQRYSK
jgi:hypothetical protein